MKFQVLLSQSRLEGVHVLYLAGLVFELSFGASQLVL